MLRSCCNRIHSTGSSVCVAGFAESWASLLNKSRIGRRSRAVQAKASGFVLPAELGLARRLDSRSGRWRWFEKRAAFVCERSRTFNAATAAPAPVGLGVSPISRLSSTTDETIVSKVYALSITPRTGLYGQRPQTVHAACSGKPLHEREFPTRRLQQPCFNTVASPFSCADCFATS